MEYDESFVPEGTENAEDITAEEIIEVEAEETAETETTEAEEEPEKTYTRDEVDDIVGKRLARERAKIHKEYDRKYGDLENVLKVGTGAKNVEEMTAQLTDFYQKNGIDIPQRPIYSPEDVEILAQADAKEIIGLGYDEAIREANRLNAMDIKDMTPRDKAVFVKLVDHINSTKTSRELEKIGVSKDVYSSDEFKEFASKFNPQTPITDIYQIYNSTKPKKNIKPAGSLKQTSNNDGAVKEYYSPEEAAKFSVEDFNKNPELYKAVCNSMQKWK